MIKLNRFTGNYSLSIFKDKLYVESMGFLGDKVVKFLFRNTIVSISIGSFNHILKESIVSKFSQILSNFSQILESNESYINLILPVFEAS